MHICSAFFHCNGWFENQWKALWCVVVVRVQNRYAIKLSAIYQDWFSNITLLWIKCQLYSMNIFIRFKYKNEHSVSLFIDHRILNQKCASQTRFVCLLGTVCAAASSSSSSSTLYTFCISWYKTNHVFLFGAHAGRS